MKLGAYTGCLHDLPLSEALRSLADLGLTSAEVNSGGHGGQDFFIYQARAFLDEIAGLSRLPRPATFAEGLHNLVVEESIIRSAQTGSAVEVPS
jgi:predicted dehydrogenase